MKCSIASCDASSIGRGLCSKHWQEAKGKGTLPTKWIREQRKPKPLEEKLAEKKRVDSVTGCWEWQGALSEDGYGRIVTSRAKYSFVHRIAFEVFTGKIPEGMDLDHLCRNRKCFNPGHLEPVTRKENVRRGLLPGLMKAKAALQTHCYKGHPLTGDNLILQGKSKNLRVCRICRCERQRLKYHKNKRINNNEDF